MKQPRNYVILFLSIMLLAAAGLLWQKGQETAEWKMRALAGEHELARQADERSGLEKRAQEAEARTGMLQSELVDAQRKPAPTSAKRTAKDKSAALPEPVTADQIKQWLADANDPAAMQRLNAQARLLLQQRYSALFAKLGFAPEQTEALTKLLIDKQQLVSDVAVAAIQNGVDPRTDPDAFQALLMAGKAGIEGQIRSFLGDNGYAQYLAYDQGIVSSNSLIRVQRILANTPDVLTEEQSVQLTQLLSSGSGNGRITPRAIADAKGFLSPAQIQALEQARAIQLANSQNRIDAALPPDPAGK